LRDCRYVESALLDSGRGGLDVESTIDLYGEVIDRFGLRLTTEPPYLLTSRLDTSIRLRSSAPRFGLRGGKAGEETPEPLTVPCSHQRLDTFAGAQDLDLGLVWRTGQAWSCTLDHKRDRLRPIVDIAWGRNALRRACARRDLSRKSTAPPSCRAARSSGSSNPWTPAGYERHSCFLTLSSRP